MKNTMKRAIVLVLVLCMATALCVTLAACNKRDSNKLYVGLECAYSPFNYTQSDSSNGAVQIYNTNYKPMSGRYANGYDVMVAKRIAEALGKELVIVKSDTSESLQKIDFSDPYYQSNLVVVVRKDSAYANAEKLADLSGAKIAAQQGTFHNSALVAQGPANGIVVQKPLADFPALINALNTKAIDGYVAEEPGAIENCASNSDFTYVRLTNNTTGFNATDADTAIAVGIKKGSALTEQINAALAKITLEERQAMMNQAILLSSGENITE